MAKKYLVSEDQVKKALNIKSFRNMSKDKIMQFVSLIPQMDREVAIAIINQFPNYADYAVHIVEQLNVMCDNILQSNSSSQKDVIEIYKTVLESIKDQLKQENLTPELRLKLNDKMIEIADKVAAKDTENKKWLTGIFTKRVTILGGALLLGAAILGVSVKGHDIPTLDDDTDDKDDDKKDDDIIDADYYEDDD